MGSPTECWTLNTSEFPVHPASRFPSDGGVCSLSDICGDWRRVPPRYFLSPKACAGILRRAEKSRKGVPPQLALALQAVARLELGVPEDVRLRSEADRRPPGSTAVLTKAARAAGVRRTRSPQTCALLRGRGRTRRDRERRRRAADGPDRPLPLDVRSGRHRRERGSIAAPPDLRDVGTGAAAGALFPGSDPSSGDTDASTAADSRQCGRCTGIRRTATPGAATGRAFDLPHRRR